MNNLSRLSDSLALKESYRRTVETKREILRSSKLSFKLRPDDREMERREDTLPSFGTWGKYNFFTDITYIDDPSFLVLSSKVSFDRKRMDRYRSNLKSTDGIGRTKSGTIGGQIYSLRSTVMMNGKKVGSTSYGSFLWPVKNLSARELSEVKELATSCLSPETSMSSPSYVLHQVVSLILLRSIRGGRAIFEDRELIKGNIVPDLTLIRDEQEYYIDISGQGRKDKMEKYTKAGLQVVILDKYLMVEALQIDDPIISALIRQSLACDKKSCSYIEEIVSRQNPGSENLLNSNFLKFLLNSDESRLEEMSKDFETAMVRLIKAEDFSLKDDVSFELELPSADIQTLAWLSPSTWPYDKPEETSGRRENWRLAIRGDELVWIDELNSTRSEDSFFEKNPRVLMDYKAFNEMLRPKSDQQLRSAKVDLRYYTEEMRKFCPEGGEAYYARDFSGKIKISKDSKKEPIPFSYKIKPIKEFSGLKNICPRNTVSSKVKDHKDFLKRLRSSSKYMDPVDRYILEQAGKEKSIDFLSRSSIYQILILWKKVAQSLLLVRSLDGFTTRIKHPRFDIYANVYCSGAPLKVDSGMTYVTLEVGGEITKTWLWRAADIKAYVIATERLVSCISGMEGKGGDFLGAADMYTLLIFENSWGFSKILKPYRYFSSGCAYNSLQIKQQYKKFKDACSDMSSIWTRKASAVILRDCLSRNYESNWLKRQTPAFGFTVENIGYEVFLINLTCKETYGKRRHRVNMSTEIMEEISLAENHESKIRKHIDYFKFFSEIYDDMSRAGQEENRIKLCMRYLEEAREIWGKTDGRFILSPIGVIMNYRSIRKIAPIAKLGTTPSYSSLLTTKSSFDGSNMQNGSAIETLSSLASKLSVSTTALSAAALFERPIDLTFRMFDKDQVGGDREISILSSEFRVIQSITESFSKMYGKLTNIDMLDNPEKISKLAMAHDLCQDGVRFTVDQTRWGPNFATTLFGYMFAIFLRYTTEAWIPMLTCFLGESKVFQMLPYPELSSAQKTGYSLAGLLGKFHMGQGIFHYTSSLWHSLTQMTIGRCISRVVSLPKDFFIRGDFFVTSDDAAHFYSVMCSKPKAVSNDIKREAYKEIVRCLHLYELFLIPFMIKTSNYKNMITWREGSPGSVEFNSVFLNSDSVGSNSLKFHYSLLDPFTSGDRLRDMRRIWDVYSDGLNSGLRKDESEILCQLLLKYRLLQWGHRSREIESILGLIAYKRSVSRGNLFILNGTKSDCSKKEQGFICNNALPHRKYTSESLSLKQLEEISQTEKEIHELEIKRENLSKAKARRLGTDRGIVLSRTRREMSQIILPFKNRIGAISASSLGYLASVISQGSESEMINYQTCRVLPPVLMRKEIKKGFGVVPYRVGEAIRVDHFQLLYSSYERRATFDLEKDSLLDLVLHMSRKKHCLMISLDSDVKSMSFPERFRYFEEKVAVSRVSGSAKRLEFIPKAREVSYYMFEDAFSGLSYLPKMKLLKPQGSLRGKSPAGYSVYRLTFRQNRESESSADLPAHRIGVIEDTFQPDLEDFIKAGKAIISTDDQYNSLSSRGEPLYLSIKISFEVAEDHQTTYIAGSEYDGMSLDELLESMGLTLEDPGDSPPDENVDVLGSKDINFREQMIFVKIRKHAAIITESWFARECKQSGLFFSLWRNGFMEEERNVNRPELAWAVGKGYRRAVEDLRYLSLNRVLNIMRDAEQQTRFPQSHNELEKIIQILEVSESAENFNLSLVGRMPAGVEISIEKPEGKEVNREQLIQVLSELSSM